MRRAAHRLPRWQLGAGIGVGIAALASGGAWLALHYSVGAGSGNLPHAGEIWLMRLHGLSAFGGLFMLGTVAAAHVPEGWQLTRRRRWSGQRASGIWLCAFAALLCASGYLLYYGASEAIHPTLGWIHTAIGVALAALVLRHRRSHRHEPE